ncbi:MAG: PQQ-binding-like beta-propeller repeat protein [Verrucomicrobia bacterium]|nr:PQQ-binding-like beta-propeller repeat protein [Verrucomicrobiota bacterium]
MNTTENDLEAAWRTAGGDASRRGLFSAAVNPGRRVARRLAAIGAVQAATVISATGTSFIADMAGHVRAFASSGQPLWETRLEGGISATPVLAPNDALLFVATHVGLVAALEAASGKWVWQKTIPSQADPRILSDLLYLATTNRVILSSWGGRFVALDAATGTSAGDWDAGISPGAAASADSAGNVYCLRAVASRGIEFVRVAPSGAETVLHGEPETSRGARRALVTAAPVLDEARGVAYLVLNGDRRATVVAWSLADSRIRWREELDVGVQGTPAVRKDGAVIVADLAGTVHGFSPGGWRIFSYATGSDYLLAGPVAEGSGRAFVGDPLGRLHVIEAEGKGRVAFEIPRAIQGRASFGPAGDLYVPGTDKTVHVLTTRRVAA